MPPLKTRKSQSLFGTFQSALVNGLQLSLLNSSLPHKQRSANLPSSCRTRRTLWRDVGRGSKGPGGQDGCGRLHANSDHSGHVALLCTGMDCERIRLGRWRNGVRGCKSFSVSPVQDMENSHEQLFYIMFSACMIGGTLYGTGRKFENLTPYQRMTAMKVSKTDA